MASGTDVLASCSTPGGGKAVLAVTPKMLLTMSPLLTEWLSEDMLSSDSRFVSDNVSPGTPLLLCACS